MPQTLAKFPVKEPKGKYDRYLTGRVFELTKGDDFPEDWTPRQMGDAVQGRARQRRLACRTIVTSKKTVVVEMTGKLPRNRPARGGRTD
jgi:hypothetical protein